MRSEGSGDESPTSSSMSQILFFAFLYPCAASTLYSRQQKQGVVGADVAMASSPLPCSPDGQVVDGLEEFGIGPLNLQQHLTIFAVAFLSGSAMNSEVFWPLITCVA